MVQIDDPAGVREIVRAIEYAPLRQTGVVFRAGQLVVGPADDRLRPQVRNGYGGQNAAQRAGRQDIAGFAQDRFVTDDLGANVSGQGFGPPGVGIRQDEVSPFMRQDAGQTLADIADALNGDPATGQAGGTPDLFGRRAHAVIDPESRGARRVSSFGQEPGGMPCSSRDHLHVLQGRTGVEGGDVAPSEALNEITHGLEQGLGLFPPRVGDDDRLAAAIGNVCDGVLVGHAPGKPQDVAERVIQGRVGKNPAAADRRPAVLVVHGDDGRQPARLFLTCGDKGMIGKIRMGVEHQSLQGIRWTGLVRGAARLTSAWREGRRGRRQIGPWRLP